MRRRMLLAKKAQPVELYLRVAPVTLLWITVLAPIEYTIESNTDWIIV